MMPWIKVRTDLHDDPRTDALARLTGHTPQHIVGALVRLWSFADQFSTDGTLAFVTRDRIDMFAGHAGNGFAPFSVALEAVHWIEFKDGVFRIPRFGEHNGETAKARAQGAVRQQRFRSRNGDGVTASNGDGVTRGGVTREEKRREEKRRGARAPGVSGGGL